MTWRPRTFTKDGQAYTECSYCCGAGRVYPLKPNGKPDYSKSVECSRCDGHGHWLVEPQATLDLSTGKHDGV